MKIDKPPIFIDELIVKKDPTRFETRVQEAFQRECNYTALGKIRRKHKFLRINGGRDSYGRTYKDRWPDIVSHIRNVAPKYPERYMAAQFVSGDIPSSYTALTDDKAQSRYRFYTTHVDGFIMSELRSNTDKAIHYFTDIDMLVDGLTDIQKWTNVLATEGYKLSALYRTCFADKLQIEDVANHWRERGLEKAKKEPHGYLKHWSEILSPQIKSALREYTEQDG